MRVSPIVCYILGRFDILIYSPFAAAVAAAADSLKTNIAQFLLQFKSKKFYFRHFFVTSQFYFFLFYAFHLRHILFCLFHIYSVCVTAQTEPFSST